MAADTRRVHLLWIIVWPPLVVVEQASCLSSRWPIVCARVVAPSREIAQKARPFLSMHRRAPDLVLLSKQGTRGKHMLDRLDASLSFYKQALDMRDRRQDVLAANIANADTPDYKARDFDFRAELDRVLGASPNSSGAPGMGLNTTTPGHIGAAAPNSVDGTTMAYRNATQPSLDGNTVDMDVERVEFMNNAVHYRANLQILGNQIKSLRAAMQPER